MNKFKTEKYISQRYNEKSKLYTFQVFIRNDSENIVKNFAESKYGSAKVAFDNAKIFRDRTLNEIREGKYIKSNNKTIEEVFNESYELFPLRAETKRKHKIMLNKYIKVKSTKIQDLTPSLIQISLNDMIETNSDEGIERVFSLWKRITKTAIIKKYINSDICYDVICPKSIKTYKPRNVIETDRNILDKVISLCYEHLNAYNAKMYENMLMTLFYTGMRPCEMVVLHKEDIDFKNMTISVNKELGSDLNNLNVIRQTKNKTSVRIIPICDDLLLYINRAKKQSKGNFLFADKNGDYYLTNSIGNDLRRLTKNEDFRFSMYTLRHLLSTDLIVNKGVDARTVQEIMGHASAKMTLEYARSNNEKKINALNNR